MAIQVYGYLLPSCCLSVFLGPCGDGVLPLFSLRFIAHVFIRSENLFFSFVH